MGTKILAEGKVLKMGRTVGFTEVVSVCLFIGIDLLSCVFSWTAFYLVD